MEIRLATFNDIEELCLLYRAFFAYNAKMQPKYYKEGEIIEDYPKSVILSKEEDIFVAVNDNVIIGFIHIQENETPPYESYVSYKYAEIIEFFIAEEFRKQGIGSKLFNSVKEWSKKRGGSYIEAMVLTNARGEIKFYEKKAFKTKMHIMRYEF